MGLFDNKKKKGRDDFGSPVEQIDLSAPSAGAAGEQDGGDDADVGARASSPGALRSPPAAQARSADPERRPSRAASPEPATRYGIDDAVALMRTLPSENIELVVQVVKHTLESARIDIATIIQDAAAKQERTEARIAVLRNAIEELDREIDTRQAEIAQLESDNRETTRVKERLVLAERLSQGARLDTVVDAPTSPVRARETGPSAAPPRAKSSTTPPPTPGSPNPTPAGGNPAHSSSGTHLVPGPVGPGGPVGSAVGPGGPAGSFSKSGATHTVISKK